MRPNLAVALIAGNVGRSLVAVFIVVGIALLSSCSTSRCGRCHCQKRITCHAPVCQPVPTGCSDAANVAPVPDVADDLSPAIELEPTLEPADPDLTTNPVTQAISLDQPIYGHGENYEWLIGVLHRVHVPRKGWKIRYAPLDQQDRWGGSVVPAADVRIDDFEDGEYVYVEGEVIGDRASLYLSGPRYRISTIRGVDEGDLGRVSRLP